METKKNPSVDLNRRSAYFFSIGLIIAMALAVMAFEWRSYGEGLVNLRDRRLDNWDVNPYIPPTRDVPPAPMPVARNIILDVVPDIDVVDDSTLLFDADPNLATPFDSHPLPEPEPEIDENIPYRFVEESATPKGGIEAFYQYISEKVKYPSQARRMGIEGRVFVEFIINKDGSFSDVKAIKGIGAGCDEEAVRIIQSAPPWKPGKQRGRPVRQRYTLPIIFNLG